MNKLSIFWGLIPLCLCGCAKTAEESPVGGTVRIAGSVVSSKAAMEAGFVVGNRIGLYMTAEDFRASGFGRPEEAWLGNHPFSLQADGVWEAPYPARWETPEAVADAVGYFPYDAANDDAADLTALPCRVAADQRSLDSLRASDFLWARTEAVSQNDGLLSLEFRHRMSKIVFRLNVTSSDNVDFTQGVVVFPQVCTAAFIDLNDGRVTADENSRQDVKAYYDGAARTAEAVLVPQTVPAGTAVMLLLGDDTNFRGVSYVFGEAVELSEGKEYVIDFTHHF